VIVGEVCGTSNGISETGNAYKWSIEKNRQRKAPDGKSKHGLNNSTLIQFFIFNVLTQHIQESFTESAQVRNNNNNNNNLSIYIKENVCLSVCLYVQD
jgi:hypothetical protein